VISQLVSELVGKLVASDRWRGDLPKQRRL